MSTIFPRLDSNLIITTGVEGPTSIKPVEAIRQEIVHKLSQLIVGKHIQGEVLAKLRDGSFIAKVDGVPMRLSLPNSTQIGEKLSLTLLNLTPRPVFLLNGQSQVTLLDSPRSKQIGEIARQASDKLGGSSESFAESDVALFNTATRAMPVRERNANDANLSSSAHTAKSTQAGSLTSSHAQATLQESSAYATIKSTGTLPLADVEIAAQRAAQTPMSLSTQTALSSTGQLINKLLLETSNSPENLRLKGKIPLLANLSNLTGANNQLPTTQLVRQLETSLRNNINQSGLFYESHVAQWASGQRSLAELQNEPQAKIPPSSEQLILANTEDSNHASLTQLIHQQLEVLEHQKIQWTGLLAPQIPVQWSIEEGQAHQHQSGAEEPAQETTWQSDLRIELPHLGTVAVRIHLNANQLQLSLKSDATATTSLLKSEYLSLQKAIENSGTHIQSFTVQHDEQL